MGTPPSELKPFGGFDVVARSLLHVDHEGHRYSVDFDYFDWVDHAALYRDGHLVDTAKAPASFEVDGGKIEFAASTFGVKRAHLTTAGQEIALRPDPKTAEAWRQRLAHRHPMVSRFLAWSAIGFLIVGLVLLALTLLELISGTDFVQAHLDWQFASPIELPGWAATVLATGGVFAIIERSLSMRHHWLLDADTWWLD